MARHPPLSRLLLLLIAWHIITTAAGLVLEHMTVRAGLYLYKFGLRMCADSTTLSYLASLAA